MWQSVAVEATIVLALTAAILVWDLFLSLDAKPDNTISEMLSAASKRWWLIAYAWAALGGHLFLDRVWDVPVWLSTSSLVLAVILVFILNAKKIQFPRWSAMTLGLLHGWLLWGQ